MTFEIKFVDLEELHSKLKIEFLEKFWEMLETEVKDNSWYEIFDSVSGWKETQEMEWELEKWEEEKMKVIEQLQMMKKMLEEKERMTRLLEE